MPRTSSFQPSGFNFTQHTQLTERIQRPLLSLHFGHCVSYVSCVHCVCYLLPCVRCVRCVRWKPHLGLRARDRDRKCAWSVVQGELFSRPPETVATWHVLRRYYPMHQTPCTTIYSDIIPLAFASKEHFPVLTPALLPTHFNPLLLFLFV